MTSLYKQSLSYFRKNALNVLVLCLLILLTSFLYFFVESSIDANLAWLFSKTSLTSAQKDLLRALTSNQLLARSFLLFLGLLTCFVLFTFYKKHFDLNRKYLGICRAMGFRKKEITNVYVNMTSLLALPCLWLGLALGYYYSYILLRNYTISYGIQTLTRGLSFSSFSLGIVVPTVLLCLVTYLAIVSYHRAEIATLLAGQGKVSRFRKLGFLQENLAKRLPSKYAFSSRIALRNLFSVLLIFVSVLTYLTLVMMSVFLNLSSEQVYQSQISGRTYSYEVNFSSVKRNNEDSDVQYFFREDVDLETSAQKIGRQSLVAMDDGPYFQLLSQGQTIDLEEEQFIINPRLAELYGLKVGDKLDIRTKDFKTSLPISAIAENAQMRAIYLSRPYFNHLTGRSSDAYNGLWTSQVNQAFSDGDIESYDTYKQKLENDNVSNRTSAIINQVLACVFASLLIFLVLLLNFQDNSQNFIYLRKLGYLTKEIKAMLINIYLPLIVVAFIISILPSIVITRYILRYLSLWMNDYMPFITNIGIISAALVFLLAIYLVVVKLFDVKLRRLFKQEEVGR